MCLWALCYMKLLPQAVNKSKHTHTHTHTVTLIYRLYMQPQACMLTHKYTATVCCSETNLIVIRSKCRLTFSRLRTPHFYHLREVKKFFYKSAPFTPNSPVYTGFVTVQPWLSDHHRTTATGANISSRGDRQSGFIMPVFSLVIYYLFSGRFRWISAVISCLTHLYCANVTWLYCLCQAPDTVAEENESRGRGFFQRLVQEE